MTLATPGVALAEGPVAPPSSQQAAPPPPPVDHTSKEAGASAPGLTPVPAPTPAEVRFRRMSVDVTSSRPDAVLERRVTVKEDVGAFLVLPWRDRSSTWEQVCVAPCRGADLDRYSTYRVAEANDISGSSPFTLPQGGDSVSLRLDAGNKFAHHVGIATGAAGVAALIVGGSLLVLASDTDQHDPQVRARTAGFITGGAGIVLLAVGLPLAILTRTTVFADDKPVRAASTKPHFTGSGLVF